MNREYINEVVGIYTEGYFEPFDGDKIDDFMDIIESYDSEHLISSGILFNVIVLLESKSVKFPCEYGLMKDAWEREFSSVDFDSVLGILVDSGMLSVKKVTASILFSEDLNIKHNGSDRDIDYLVIYASGEFEGLVDEVSSYFTYHKSSKAEKVEEDFGFSVMSGVFKNFLGVLRKSIRSYLGGITVMLESFAEVDENNTVEFDVLLEDSTRQLSEYSERAVKKALGKIKNQPIVEEVNVYKEAPNSIYLGLTITKNVGSKDLIELSSFIASCVNAIFNPEE